MQQGSDSVDQVKPRSDHPSNAGGMMRVKRLMISSVFVLLAVSAPAAVNVFIQGSNSLAWVRYECTTGEVVRAFALNVTVDHGQIIGISDFLRGPSTAAKPGYGIFPASFRDHITVGPGTNVNWNVQDYTPLAVVADDPVNTLPGLNSTGVTLEFGGLWDSAEPGAVPGTVGTLCALHLSEQATVSVSANLSRGGVVGVNPDVALATTFTGALVAVQTPAITGLALTNGMVRVTFVGGELQTSPAITGPWADSGNSSGEHIEPVATGANKFYRVHGP